MVITKDQYEAEVRNQAGYLADSVEDTGNDPLEDVVDVLDGHGWFHHGCAASHHGAIIHHSEAPIEQFRDMDSYIAGHHDPAKIVENLAFACFEADVIEEAYDLIEV